MYKIHSSEARTLRRRNALERDKKRAASVYWKSVTLRRGEKMLSRLDCASFGTLLESIVWIKDALRENENVPRARDEIYSGVLERVAFDFFGLA